MPLPSPARTRTSPRARASTSAEARARRSEALHRREVTKLRGKCERLAATCDELRKAQVDGRSEIARLRRVSKSCETLLRAARDTHQEQERKAEEWRRYAVSLEAKVCSGSDGNAMAAELKKLRARCRNAERSLAAVESDAADRAAQLAAREKEVRVLSRALEIRSHDLAADADGDASAAAKLLHDAAQSREEAHNLSVEVGARQAECDALRRELRELQKLEADFDGRCRTLQASLERSLEDAEGAEERAKRAIAAEEAALSEQSRLQTLLHRSRSDAADARRAAEELRGALEGSEGRCEELRGALEEARREASQGKRATALAQRQLAKASREKEDLQKAAEQGAGEREQLALLRREAADLRKRLASARQGERRAAATAAEARGATREAAERERQAASERDAAVAALREAVNVGARESVASEALRRESEAAKRALRESQEERASLSGALLERCDELQAELLRERGLRLRAEALVGGLRVGEGEVEARPAAEEEDGASQVEGEGRWRFEAAEADDKTHPRAASAAGPGAPAEASDSPGHARVDVAEVSADASLQDIAEAEP